jgi:hypothetical protein
VTFPDGFGRKDVTAGHVFVEGLKRFIFPVSPTIRRFNGLTFQRC